MIIYPPTDLPYMKFSHHMIIYPPTDLPYMKARIQFEQLDLTSDH
jgi:hypothetical protein